MIVSWGWVGDVWRVLVGLAVGRGAAGTKGWGLHGEGIGGLEVGGSCMADLIEGSGGAGLV